MKSVVVRAPASTANLGPGFDCLGLAVSLYNTLEMSFAEQGVRVEIEGQGEGSLPRGARNLMVRAARRVFDAAGQARAGLHLRVKNQIPLSSGLGSSAAAIVAGLFAANQLTKNTLSREDLFGLAYGMEGHADNAAASLYGGLNLVSALSGTPTARPVPMAKLKLIVALPHVSISTKQMRRALPRRVPLGDAVFNIGRALFTVEALRAGDYQLLAIAMEDRLHQRHRLRFIPAGEAAMAAARKAGAAAVAVSGAGPSLVAFAPDRHQQIADAMARTFEKSGLRARTFVLDVESRGVRVVQQKEGASGR